MATDKFGIHEPNYCYATEPGYRWSYTQHNASISKHCILLTLHSELKAGHQQDVLQQMDPVQSQGRC